MNLTTKLLSAVAATTLTAAALTFTTTTPAEARPAGLADLCHSFGGLWRRLVRCMHVPQKASGRWLNLLRSAPASSLRTPRVWRAFGLRRLGGDWVACEYG